MNDIHSDPEWIYKRRRLARPLREATDAHPVLFLTGPRQVGKSTLLQEERPFRSWRYLSLDDIDVLG
ncbi:MAG: AAA family ATPase, partial [Planctomycetota bacterium]